MIRFSEAIRLQDGQLCNLAYHQERVDRTLRHFYRTTINLSVLDEQITPAQREGLYKCRVLYSNRIESVEIMPYSLRPIRQVAVVADNEIDYAYKYEDRRRLRALLEASGCDDVLIVKQGVVTDASYTNVVFEGNGRWITPKECLLRGTRRQALLDSGQIEERSVRVEEIVSFQRVHFINAMIGLEDSVQVETNRLTWLVDAYKSDSTPWLNL